MPGRRGYRPPMIRFIFAGGQTFIHIEGDDLPLGRCKVLLVCKGGRQLDIDLKLSVHNRDHSLYIPDPNSGQDPSVRLHQFFEEYGPKETALLCNGDKHQTPVGQFLVTSESV
jgi:hypothetical protein